MMKKKSKVSFFKMEAAGNDFIIFDARKSKIASQRVEFVQEICHRHFGIGADGVFFIEKAADKKNDFKWDFYNADGSIAEMCGNGARCVARFAFDYKIAKNKMKFETLAGVVGATVKKNMVEIQMPQPKVIFKSVQVPLTTFSISPDGGEKIEVAYWNTGVPHVVLKTDDWSEEYLFETGRFLRNHDFFKKTNGANVTFYSLDNESIIQAVTFERGVEGVTLSCGTGAVAAAAQAVLEGQKSPILVHMPGGDLKVSIKEDFSQATLMGEARYVYKGELL